MQGSPAARLHLASSLLPPPSAPGAAAGRAGGRRARPGLAAGGRRGPALRRLLGPHPAVPGAAGAAPRRRLAPAQLRGLRAQDLGALHVLQQLGAEPAALRLPGLALPPGLPRGLPLRPSAAPRPPPPLPRSCTAWALGAPPAPAAPGSRASVPRAPWGRAGPLPTGAARTAAATVWLPCASFLCHTILVRTSCPRQGSAPTRWPACCWTLQGLTSVFPEIGGNAGDTPLSGTFPPKHP